MPPPRPPLPKESAPPPRPPLPSDEMVEVQQVLEQPPEDNRMAVSLRWLPVFQPRCQQGIIDISSPHKDDAFRLNIRRDFLHPNNGF